MASLILASASPRRREILDKMGVAYEVIPSAGEEMLDASLPLADGVIGLARAKAEEIAAIHPDRLVLGADTVVAIDGQVLGKPPTEEDAFAMLFSLQGRWHQVLTGVWVASPDGGRGFASVAEVCFYPLSEQEIRDYIATGEPMDKAGSYGIQGLGMRFVKKMRGDYYNVMGLPGGELWHFLQTFPGFHS